MRTTRHDFTVYPAGWRPHQKFYKRKSVLQAKKLAQKFGPGTEVWRCTRTKGHSDGLLASTFTNDFEFEVV